MKRVSVIVLAAAAVVLAGCGSDESSEGDGLRQSSTTAARAASPTAATSAAPGTESPAPSSATAETEASQGSASRTTCGEFRTLDPDAEKALIAQIIAENPGNPFERNPNAALGTAKLVCLQDTKADTPVAEVAGIK